MKSDIDIAQNTKLLPILEIGRKLDLKADELELYGDFKAKVKYEAIKKRRKNKEAKLILVTAINPTPAGEGKTTTTIGLGQALCQLGKKAIICLREPSLGPVFGIKGGAAGGGYAQVLPMEDINLHFTGDLHAVGTANNLVSAVIDNHIHKGNSLNIDVRTISWHRVLDMNDRALRNIIVGLGGKANGFPREDHFDITVASEIMAVLCLANDLNDLKKRIEKIVVAASLDMKPIRVKDLKISGAVAALLKDALKPNLVQTIEQTPAFIHGGPFANIAHGCNSLVATKLALRLGDYVVTEAGFGADLGAEKFFNLKCRFGNLKPSGVVIVATVRALKHHGNGRVAEGLENLEKHIANMRMFGLEPVVAINIFSTDTQAELKTITDCCKKLNVEASHCSVWQKGGKGGLDLAVKVLKAVSKKKTFKYLYRLKTSLKSKIEAIALEIYGADGVVYTDLAEKQIQQYASWGLVYLPVCMAKTQYSLSDNPVLINRPKNFKITINSVRLSAGAGFFVCLAGDIMTMPGLPSKPSAELIDIDNDARISGLF